MRKQGERYNKQWTRGHPRGDVIRTHVLVAEAALGKHLPPGAIVHHVNGDSRDNRNCNLVICQDQAYHFMLHRYQRVNVAGGNPHTQAVCCRCRLVKNKSEFPRRRGRPEGNGDCRPCGVARKRELRLKRKVEAANVALV